MNINKTSSRNDEKSSNKNSDNSRDRDHDKVRARDDDRSRDRSDDKSRDRDHDKSRDHDRDDDESWHGPHPEKGPKHKPVAKDDIFTGLSEDSISHDLNVLANDPASAQLWSLDQNPLNGRDDCQQPQKLDTYTLASGAVIAINADGTVRYTGTAAQQSLAAGEIFTDSFLYTIRLTNGALSTAQATVNITGVNDAAVFSGAASGSVQEDGVLGVGGILSVSDPDQGQSAFASTGSLAGSYGDFTFDTGTGAWTYALRNTASNVQALMTGQTVQDILMVSSLDGTAGEIVVSIGGQNEVPNPSLMWVATTQNVTRAEGGLQIPYINGVARLIGFDKNDMLNTTSLGRDSPFIEQIDTDGVNGVDSTLVNLVSGTQQFDIVLVGNLDFTVAQVVAPR